MTGESILQFESSSIQNILIALVVICAIVYGFIEFRKINMRLQELEVRISRMSDMEPHMIQTMDSYEKNNEETMNDIEANNVTFNETCLITQRY